MLFDSLIHHINVSAGERNQNLKKISDWAFQWKIMENKPIRDILFKHDVKNHYLQELSM